MICRTWLLAVLAMLAVGPMQLWSEADGQAVMNQQQVASPAGYWPGDGDADDASGSGNDGTLNGATFTTGVKRQAFYFDGASNVSMNGVGAYQFGTGDFSVAFWVLFDNFTADDSGIAHKDSYPAAGYNGWLFNVCGQCPGSSGVGMQVRNSAAGLDGNARIPTSSLQTGKWYHVAGVRSGTSLKLYLDGTLASSAVMSAIADVSNDGELNVGSLSSGSRQYFNGSVDELRVYDHALRPADVAALAIRPPAGYWPGDGDGDDASGNGNDGTLNGATFTAGLQGQAFHFDGASNVSANGVGAYQFGAGDFSVAFWVLFDNLDANDSGIAHKDSYPAAGYNGWLFNICAVCPGSSGMGFEVRNSAAGLDANARVPTSSLQTGKWYHVAGVRSGTSLKLYIDGALASSAVMAAIADVSNDGELNIGSLSSGSRQYFNGAVDETRVYGHALTPEEVAALAFRTPVGYWPAEGDAADASVNGNDGTLNGATFSAGVKGQAFHFDGASNASMNGAGAYQFGTGDFSVAFWVLFDNLDANDSGIAHKDSYPAAGYNGWLFNICAVCPGSSGMGFEVRDSAAGLDGNARVPTSSLQTTKWYHVAGVRSGTSLRLYVDGTLASSAVMPDVANVSNDGELNVGSLSSGSRQYFNGSVDEMRVYRYALSEADVTILATRSDSTPPLVTPTVSGALGGAGWYVSDVAVTWTVEDAESAISSTDGCDRTSVTSDTSGVVVTCSATSAGGTATQSVTIKRDATPPTATAAASPPANVNGWRKTNVTVSFAGTDALSGGVTCDAQIVVTTEGANQSASGRCFDAAGNASAASVNGINIDKTGPTVAISSPSDGAVYNRNQFVDARFVCSDSLSGVKSTDCSGSVGLGQLIDTSKKVNNGKFTVTSVDHAANMTKRTINYSVK